MLWKTDEWKTAKKKTDNDIAILIFKKDSHVKDSWVKDSQVIDWQWYSSIDEKADSHVSMWQCENEIATLMKKQKQSCDRQLSERKPSKRMTMK